MPRGDLERARRSFLDSMSVNGFDRSGAQGLVAYWRAAEQEARQTENIGQIDKWTKELARDRDRVAALREQARLATASGQGDPETLSLIHRILALLEDVMATLRKRGSLIRNTIGMWVFLMGPGSKSKPKDLPGDGSEAEKKSDQAVEAALAKKDGPKKPSKSKSA